MRSRLPGILLALSILPFIFSFASAEAPAYYLVEYDGYIAVLDAAKGQLCLYTETPVNSLPPADAERICQGLACTDEIALAKALENFCS